MARYPQPIVPVDHVEPVPRRIRARARRPSRPRHHPRALPLGVAAVPAVPHPGGRCGPEVLVDEERVSNLSRGRVARVGLRVGDVERAARAAATWSRRSGASSTRSASTSRRWTPGTRRTSGSSSIPATPTRASTRCARPDRARRARRPGPRGVLRADRRVRDRAADALVRRAHGGRLLAPASVRHRDRLPVQGPDHRLLVRRTGDRSHPDLAWTYDFPTAPLLPITGLVAFYDEKVDVFLDGVEQERPCDAVLGLRHPCLRCADLG